jgi:hypothetical protein
MTLESVFSEGILNFIASNMDAGAFKSDHWTFIHIPKTAGSSFREEIANVRQPDYNIEVNYVQIDPEKMHSDYVDLMAEAIRIYADKYFERTRFVSGHFKYADIAGIEKFQGSRLITMLREPLARLKSDFAHRTSPEHPLWEANIARYPTFRHFIEDPGNQNQMFKYVCQDRDDSLEATVAFLRNRFTWIGIQEQYTFSIKVLFTLFGMRIRPAIRLRTGKPEQLAQLVMSAEDHRVFRELNRMDIELYSFFLEKYKSVTPEFFAYSDFDRIFKRLNGLPFAPVDPPA